MIVTIGGRVSVPSVARVSTEAVMSSAALVTSAGSTSMLSASATFAAVS